MFFEKDEFLSYQLHTEPQYLYTRNGSQTEYSTTLNILTNNELLNKQ